jgi:hypothetical protein
MDFPENAIVIDQVEGPGDGTDLEDSYFIWVSDSETYTFYDMNGNELKSGLTVGGPFSFALSYVPDIEWTLTIGPGSDSTYVTGNWTDAPNCEPEGSYQAQAGGGAEVKKNAASASV